ncbi:MAG: aspartate/glutamate racemase family protein, partial [Spirochaetales bacterium]|nr:aspartate/glutamate racemase family protein [Spirochaetales bacterium]
RCNVYDKYFDNIVKPDEEVAKAVHQAIYDKEYGIKACSGVSDRAREVVSSAVEHLKGKGCSVVILGCTELPLVFNGKRSYKGTDLVDPTEILAIALIRETEPEKLALDSEMLCKLDGHKNPC